MSESLPPGASAPGPSHTDENLRHLDDTTKRQRLVSGGCVRLKNVARVMPSDTTSRLLKEHFRVEQPYEQASMLWIARASGELLKHVPLDLGIALPVHYEIEKYSAQLVGLGQKGPAMSHAHERDLGVKGVARMIMYTECLNDLMRKNAQW